MAIIPMHIVDAFAEQPFTGNPAAIIPNAASLSETEMLQIAEELNMEAGFVLPPRANGADIRIRFFTKRREAMLSGHVAVAAFTSMADRGFFKPTTEGLRLRQETGVGVLPVTLTAAESGRTLVTLELPRPRFGEPVLASEVGAALDVPADVFRIGDFGPQRVSCGFDVIVVPVNDRNVIRGRFRDMEAIQRLADRRGACGLACFCPETYSETADFHCRFFHPGFSADEDVASGTSLAAVASFCVDKKLLPVGRTVQIITEQGHSLGRPNTAQVVVHTKGSDIERVELTTTGAVVMRGSFQFNRRVRRASI